MQQVTRRAGETGPIPFRSGRFFNIGNQWYFACREGMDKGPFNSRHMAEMALEQHVYRCQAIHELEQQLN